MKTNHNQGCFQIQPPQNARSQVIKNENGQLQLFLPKLGFGCFNTMRLLFLTGWTMGWIVLGIFVLPGNNNLMAYLIIPLPALAGIYSLAMKINKAMRTETLKIDDQQLTLTEKPLFGNTSKVYSLNEIQEVEFEQLTGKPGRSKCDLNLVFGNGKVRFFKHEKPEGMAWLADCLDQLVKGSS